VLQDGAISEFLTAPTGEMFALLRDHSVLVRDAPQAATTLGGAAAAIGGLVQVYRQLHDEVVINAAH
jgi:2-keto-3-deoxy-galactonokinase